MDSEKLIKDIVANVISGLQIDVPEDSSVNISEPVNDITGKILSQRDIVCGVSVRHVHLCRAYADILFGKDYQLQVLRQLYQPGTYAYKETVTIVGPKLSAIQNVRILGPLRNRTQVELAKTDCIILGIDAPIRPSGVLSGTASAVLIGPRGAVYLEEGVIRANRHIHLSQEDANYFGIKDDTIVSVRVQGPKGLIFNNVQARVSSDFKSEMHVDTDDANAADIVDGTMVEIIKDASCINSNSIASAAMADKNSIPPQIPDGSYSGEITDVGSLNNIGGLIPQKISVENPADYLYGGSQLGKKTVITVEDLDKYKDNEIEVNGNVILSPLARDEALKRGIKINYKD